MLNNLLLDKRTRMQLESLFCMDETMQSIILYGKAGLGKRVVAEELSRYLLDYGGELPVSEHPDFLSLSSDNGQIGKEEIAYVKEKLRVHPAYAKRKVVLVSDAEKLTNLSQNSLLKILEDDVKDTVFLFVSQVRLLPTIESRCHLVEFYPADMRELSRHFQKIRSDVPLLAILASEGCIGRAVHFAADELFLEKTGKFLKAIRMNDAAAVFEACGMMKEKDPECIMTVFDPEQLYGFFSLLKQIFYHHYLTLCGVRWEDDPLLGNEKYQDTERILSIYKEAEHAQSLCTIKGNFTQNDLFWLLTRLI